MRERDRDSIAVAVLAPHRLGDALHPEQAAGSQASDRDDQRRPDQLELPLAPERAELLLPWLRGAVAAARRSLAGVATRHGGAIEGRVEFVLVELQPPAEGPPCATPPGKPFLALDNAGRLAEHKGPLAFVGLHDRQRLERIAGFDAGPADPIVTLKRSHRAIARAPARHLARGLDADEPPTTEEHP